MKRLNVCVFFLAGLIATQVMTANEVARPEGLAATMTSFIADDDGGVVQVVPAGLTPAGPRKANTVPAMKSIRQVSVFLGSAWAGRGVHSREASLRDLAGNVQLAPLHAQNIGVLPASPGVEYFADLEEPVNDLSVQKKLVEMLGNKALPLPDASTVFVVFLAPGVKLTVGSHTAGVHFAAYHNLVHVEAGELRYVVVPFNKNANDHATAASLAIVNAVFNPASY